MAYDQRAMLRPGRTQPPGGAELHLIDSIGRVQCGLQGTILCDALPALRALLQMHLDSLLPW